MIALTYPPCPTRRIDTPPTFSVLERVKVYMPADTGAGIAVVEATVHGRGTPVHPLPVRDQLGCYWVGFGERFFLAHECELVASLGWEERRAASKEPSPDWLLDARLEIG